MKKILSSILSFVLLMTMVACKPNYEPSKHLSQEEVDNIKYLVSRYVCKLPNFATEATKFDAKFDDAYQQRASRTKLSKYYQKGDDTLYFEIVKLAPSLKKKYTATGGKLVLNDKNKIVHYEEVYRTWKMKEDLLAQRTPTFFEGMLQGKDLSPYYTENINSDTYIEFPNKFTKFDVDTRKWVFIQDIAYNR